MNAIPPASAFDLTADRFDSLVSSAFAASRESRHVRDRLIAQVDGGRLDHVLLRARSGVAGLSDAVNRKAALNIIDFAFEPIVLQNMSTDQAMRYLGAVENALRVREARGLDYDGPLWVDTIHHVCVFSVLFQLAAFIGKNRRFGQVVLLHQGQRPEPRLRIVADLLRRAHGVSLVLLPLRRNWFARLGRLTTPDTVIYYLTDMPPEAFPQAARRERGRSRLLLTNEQGPVLQVETVSGSQSFARRLGARRVMLDYPSPDSVRIRPIDTDEAAVSLCPLEDWLFWPLLGTARQQAVAHNGVVGN
ncbi:hypothetical protein J6524_16480 [Bradyrhizobium sp. WSM 1738]|uniref:hypothetical protein n=1 Tax=Bradyrhizobium hereditatis TaxID=2821405 RepID=UPI001CE244B8|nr:hypothetical protein [Bradyrhizobium hereditatis]MCA6116483.1 hypothetical protein [Bradyrhizobium hereditatis]